MTFFEQCFPNWTKYRLKSQLQIGFALLSLVTLSALLITIVVFTVTTTAKQEARLTDRLTATVQQQTQAIVDVSVNTFDSSLARTAANYLSPQAYTAAAEWTRVDFVYAEQPTYYEWRDMLAVPRDFNARYNSTVSFVKSGFSLGRQNPYTQASTWPVFVNRTVQRTEIMSEIMKGLYQGNPEFLAGYYCLRNANMDGTVVHSPSMSMFREYPAVSNGNFAQMLAYECTQDKDWYVDVAQSVNDGESDRRPQFTQVYFDAWVHQTMITIVQPLFHPDTGSFIGMAGADLLTETLQQSINDVRYLEHGRAILFEVDVTTRSGTVIADTARTGGTPQTRLLSYKGVTSPTITNKLWDDMYKRSADGSPITSFVDSGDWYVSSQSLSTGNHRYLLSVFVLKADVLTALETIVQDIASARRVSIVMNACVCGGGLLLALGVTFILAQRIVAPVQRLAADSVKLIEQIGRDDIGQGIEMTVPDSDITETRQLQEAHRNMIASIQQQQQQIQVQQQAAAAVTDASSVSATCGASSISWTDSLPYALPAYAPDAPFDQGVLLSNNQRQSSFVSPSGDGTFAVFLHAPQPPPYNNQVVHPVQVHLGPA